MISNGVMIVVLSLWIIAGMVGYIEGWGDYKHNQEPFPIVAGTTVIVAGLLIVIPTDNLAISFIPTTVIVFLGYVAGWYTQTEVEHSRW